MPATKYDIYLTYGDGTPVLLSIFGRKLTISDTKISRQQRTASGRLVEDVITTKKVFTISYSMISGTDLDLLIALYEGYNELTLQIGLSDVYTVLMDPIERERLLMLDDGLWGGVELKLHEV